MCDATTRAAGRPTGQLRTSFYARGGFRCLWCGRTVVAGVDAELDHIVPFKFGGTWDAANLVVACGQCNSTRGALSVSTWIRKIAARMTSSKSEWRKEVNRIHARMRAQLRRALPRVH